MARDILAIPMSTSISNSAFYIEPMTINSIFDGLDPDIIEASTCGGDWLDNPTRITPNKDNDHSPEPTYSPSVFAGTYSSLETQEKHAPFTADTVLMLGNPVSTSCPDPLPTRTATEVVDILRRNEAQGLQHNSMRSQEYSWSPPPSSWLKFNVGAEVHDSNTFLAAVVRNDVGDVVEAGIALDNVTSSLVAEALAFKYAMNLIKQYSVRKAIIEGDAPLVVNALKGRKTDAPLEINGIVQEVFAVLDTCTDTIVDFSCVNKSCNSLAYDCIKWATRNRFWGILPISWFTGASFIGPTCV
ncbi:uncharacterized protein LOC115963370 [Quercus lobata]|uniref:uncharacterized protein LOC115963370 n=1 Tax=Quercus lobata TaxID=97700 RepID=UPI0012467AF0|nr:uncharacterized protein LOC115963370 [Quercus lobata]